MEDTEDALPSHCDACGLLREPLLKLSLGTDFFGRPYDRLSPSADKSPQWYCDTCSMHKNLQRDFRDILSELTPLKQGQPSALQEAAVRQQAHLRLKEIALILKKSEGASPFLEVTQVEEAMQDMQHLLQSTPSSSNIRNN